MLQALFDLIYCEALERNHFILNKSMYLYAYENVHRIGHTEI